MKPHRSGAPLPRCSATETHILQLRAAGQSYRQISTAVKLAPRKVWDTERTALTKVLAFLESEAFLAPLRK